MDFYVIGATARDIILSNLHDLVPDRKTDDLDIAIAISDWSQFQSIEENLPKKEDFEKGLMKIYNAFRNWDGINSFWQSYKPRFINH